MDENKTIFGLKCISKLFVMGVWPRCSKWNSTRNVIDQNSVYVTLTTTVCVQTAKLVKFMVASNMQSIFSDFHSSLYLCQ